MGTVSQGEILVFGHPGITPTAKLTTDLAQRAQVLITMGCGDQCPVVAGLKREDWPLEDPKGKSLARVREICDEIGQHIEALLERERWRP